MSENNETQFPELIQAIIDNDLDKIKQLVRDGTKVTIQDQNGFQPIHHSAESENTEIMKFLIENGADPLAVNPDSIQPIHLAANMGLIENCKILIEDYSADMNAQDSQGWTPLCYAVRAEAAEIIIYLLGKGVDPLFQYSSEGYTALHLTAELGNLHILQTLKEMTDEFDVVNNEGLTLLHSAAMGAYSSDVVKYLIEEGLDPNVRDDYHWYPVHYAVREQNVDTLKTLLENGANPYHTIGDQYNAYDQASEKGNQDIINILEEFKDQYTPPDEPADHDDAQYPGEEEEQEQALTTEFDESEESEYTNEYEVTDNAEIETFLKDIISKWSNTIPHHDMKNFGNLIETHDIHYRPSYMLIYRTLYDHRQVGQDSVPYSGQSIPQRKYYQPSDVDIWNFELAETDVFRDFRNSYRVPGSEHVVTCPTCGGSGKITCPKCHGHGRVTCPSCRGRGTETCYSCYGSGRKTCSACGGSGQRSYTEYYSNYVNGEYSHTSTQLKYQTCSSCGGSGRVRCSVCGGRGTLTCKRCGGSGKITCSLCGGTGSITCTTCNGHGKMMNYFYIDQTLRDSTLHSCIHNGNVFERYPKFYIHPLKTEGDVKLDQTAQNLPQDILDKTHISRIYRDVHEQAVTRPPIGVLGRSTKIQLQNVRVIQVDVYDINYTYQGKDYRLTVWGYDTLWDVYASESPFSELRDKFVEKAETAFKWRRLGKSFTWLDKAQDLDVHEECDRLYEMKEIIAQKMYRQYKLDAVIGGILSGGLFGFLTYRILQKPHFIIPSLNEHYFESVNIANKHHFVVAGLYLLYTAIFHKRVYHFVKEYYNTGIRSEIMRFIFPIIVSLFFGGLAWGVLYLANASGLTLIVTGVINFLISAVQWIIGLFQH